MKISLSWLKEFIDLSLPIEKISEALTLAGIEVEEVASTSCSFQGVVTVKVLEAIPHPNADRLRIARVFDGSEEYQIVCGAPNCRTGLITALAKIGATLTDENGKPWKIKRGKLRDVESFGMLCSAKELGLLGGDGIIEFSEDTILGTDVTQLYSDVVLDISLTPNLGHCLSIYGMARELSAILQIPLKKQPFVQEPSTTEDRVQIEIADKKNCLRYCSRIVENITIGPSPNWLVKKLESCGIRSINNVVDISNYVMLETGQPLHFFDLDWVHGKHLTITSDHAFSSIRTLDEEERVLPPHTLLICDAIQPLAIAGIMGAATGSISSRTKNVLIESAVFSPEKVRSETKALGLKTDSSHRFERGVDPLMTPIALDYAAHLLCEIAQGSTKNSKIDLHPSPFIAKKILCRESRVNQLLGLTLSLREIAALLQRLQMKIVKEHDSSLEVLIPSFRNDLHEEIDLVEEIAKLYGYNHIPRSPSLHVSSSLSDAPLYKFENEVRDRLLQEGLQECITCDLISPVLAEATLEKNLKDIHLISVLQSKSVDFSTLRPSLLPGLLQMVKYNYDHQNQNLSGFEIGRIHYKEKDVFKEQTSAGIILTGRRSPHHHSPKPDLIDFYDLKGMLENMLEAFGIRSYSFISSHLHNFQPGRQGYIEVNGLNIGICGEVHPKHLTMMDIPQRVYFAEINLHDWMECRKRRTQIAPLPLYPCSERDWTLTVTHMTPIQTILDLFHAFAPPLLEKVFLLDLYQGEKLGADRKNVTFRFVYRDLNKTVSLETVEQAHTKLVQTVAEKLHDCIL